jgi:hypothetical protein
MRRFVNELSIGDVQLDPIAKEDLQRIVEILTQYADMRLDFVDAVIVTIAERRGITKILTLDRRHFMAIRPRHCPYFEILP